MDFKFIGGDDESQNAITLHGYTFLVGEFVTVRDVMAIEALGDDPRFESRAIGNAG